VATQPGHFEPDTWYTLRLEIIGDQALASCNGFTALGRYEKFGLPKTLLVLSVGKSAHELRHLRIYEASPNPQWTNPPASRTSVPIESLPDRGPLSAAVREKLNHMTPIFDGQTLNGWIQAPVSTTTIGREDVLDATAFARRLSDQNDPVSAWFSQRFDEAAKAGLAAALAGNTNPRQTVSPMLKSINATLGTGLVYEGNRFKGVALRPQTEALLQKAPKSFELGRLNRLLLEDAYPQELAKSADSAWVAKDGVLASTGVGRGVLYSEKDYTNYRLTFLVRQRKGNHFPGVLLFCQRPPAGEAGLDALGGIQFAVPSAGHWDYRPGINRSGSHFRRPFRVGFNLQEWTQVEILVNGDKGTARMALAQPPGTRGLELLRFDDPSVIKTGPIALQMHNAQLFDEYKDLRIEENPREPDLLWTIQ
ncbi:MAG: 3-keto-disaccharide hydrolase, partial [Verrucomicrobiota bacterium]